jgi:DMSO/TMAO reductase YedYZ molybdopterin-dependent catalytic subunit
MFNKKLFAGLLLLVIVTVLVYAGIMISLNNSSSDIITDVVEVREYQGKNLSSINDARDVSIKGTQTIDKETYRLNITGLVNNALEYTYDDIINNNQHYKKVVTLRCVMGWSATILWEGVQLMDILEAAEIDPAANTVIFSAYDGYTTSLPLDFIITNNIMIAYKMNNVTLPPQKGFPFQLVAESKYGYKWIKWITGIELSDNENYRGYWESRGYPIDAGLP